ncbi:MAG: A/G-specific adenine glycosylase [Bacteroidetes bacterium]|nr:A/G-specific adenine glycosylase [Bacteroidota bacterium]
MQSFFTDHIIEWYQIYKRSLPWRDTQNPYLVWLSEIMLQQTRVAQGLPYYEKFCRHYPTVFDLAHASEQQVLKDWQGLGYYSRARNLHQAAKQVVSNFNGVFPQTFTDLKKLKGVGDYTAAAIASFCFDEPVAVLDGNVYRVLSRYFGIQTPVNSTIAKKEFNTLAQKLIPKDQPGIFNQAIMEFGALQCKPKNPNCSLCPIAVHCTALKHGQVGQLPIKLKKKKEKLRFFNYLIYIDKDQKIVMKKREQHDIWKHLYDFPLIESGDALSRSSIEQHPSLPFFDAARVELFNKVPKIHKLTHQHLHIHYWLIYMDKIVENALSLDQIKLLPKPVVVENFFDAFRFS